MSCAFSAVLAVGKKTLFLVLHPQAAAASSFYATYKLPIDQMACLLQASTVKLKEFIQWLTSDEGKTLFFYPQLSQTSDSLECRLMDLLQAVIADCDCMFPAIPMHTQPCCDKTQCVPHHCKVTRIFASGFLLHHPFELSEQIA